MGKAIKYHKSHTFKDLDGVKHTFVTQLYQVGVYGILDNNPALQGSFEPSAIVSMEKKMLRLEKDGIILDFSVGMPIKVTNESGFWEEVLN